MRRRYDDARVDATFGGARVYSSTLYPGDSVYIPVGGLHGGSNVGTDTALAITGNYHDAFHHDLLLRTYCEDEILRRIDRKQRSGKRLSRLKSMLEDKSCLFWAGVFGAL